MGKANAPTRRLSRHLKDVDYGKTDHKTRWIAKLRREAVRPACLILEECPEADWKTREQWWIVEGRRLGWRLTNVKDGGDGLDPTPETRAKMRAAKVGVAPHNKGKRTPDDVRIRQSEAARLRWGRMSLEAMAEWGRAMTGRMRAPISEETREKLRDVARNRVFSPERLARTGAALRRIPRETEARALELLACGMKSVAIVRACGVSPAWVSRLKHGKAYKVFDV